LAGTTPLAMVVQYELPSAHHAEAAR
jgi:hypothetical protein